MKKNVLNTLKIVVSVLLVVWLVQKLNWELVLTELKDINYAYLVLFVLLQLFAIGLSSKRWQVIARSQKLTFTVWEGFKVYLTGTFINNFLPSTIGGDIYRSLWLAKRAESRPQAFSTVVFDRFLGLVVTAFFALVGGYFVWLEKGRLEHFLVLSYVGLIGFFVVFFVFIFFASRMTWIARYIEQIPWQKLKNLIISSLSYTDTRLWRDGLWWTFTFIFVGLGLSNYVLFLALGHTLPFLPFLGLVFMMALYVSLPISISNIGVKEWAYGILFTLLGVSFETAITVALLSRFLQTGISLLALPFYLTSKSKK